MSFDIRLSVFSPGYVWSAHVDDARVVLRRYGARASGRHHCYSARWEDGSGLAVYSRALFDAAGPFSALLTPLGGLSRQFCDFTYDFAAAVGCAIRPDVIPPLTVVVRPATVVDLPAGLRESRVVCVSSGAEVRDALAEGYNDWQGMVRDAVRRLEENAAPGEPGG
jgi:hypothetical protein